ncbi:MAG: hypothetical protein KF901_28655 [Myxococcales bacterium]|nr:hypothetical protein [Myxococcales bacterium]
MEELLAIAFAFPTVVYTALVLVSLVYWLVGIVGLVDMDLGADGAVEAAAGKVDGALDAAEVDGAVDASEATDGIFSSLHSLLSALRLRHAPLTITASVLFLFAWVFSYLGARYLAPVVPGPELVGQLAVFLGALVPAVPLTSLLTRPLGPLFQRNPGRGKRDLLGHTGRVRISAAVGERAQIRVRIGGDDLLLRARADAELPTGAEVLLVDYDEANDTFIAEPMSAVMNDESSR